MAKVVNFKKFYKGNQDKIFKEAKNLLKLFPKEQIQIMPSSSKDSDALHSLGYGKKQSVKKSIKTNEYFIRFGCGCGFIAINPSPEFAQYVAKFGVTVSNNEVKKDTIELTKASNLAEDSYLLPKDEFVKRVDQGVFVEEGGVITTPSGITYASSMSAGVAYDEYELKTLTTLSKTEQEFFSLYGVDSAENITFRQSASSSVSSGTYTESVVVYSNQKKELTLNEKLYNVKAKANIEYISSSSVVISSVDNQKSIGLFNSIYGSVNIEDILSEHKKLT